MKKCAYCKKIIKKENIYNTEVKVILCDKYCCASYVEEHFLGGKNNGNG